MFAAKYRAHSHSLCFYRNVPRRQLLWCFLRPSYDDYCSLFAVFMVVAWTELALVNVNLVYTVYW